jgi:methionyl-tRNA synthetase
VLDPREVLDSFGVDALRYYLIRDVPFGSDGAVGMAAAKARYENELANEYGNLASRTIAMIHRYCDGRVPDADTDPELAAEFEGLVGEVIELIDAAEITTALDRIWQRVRRANRFVEERAPWQLAKDPKRTGELHRVLASLAEAVRVLSVLLSPYIPNGAGTLLDTLGSPDLQLAGAEFARRTLPRDVAKLAPLYPKR